MADELDLDAPPIQNSVPEASQIQNKIQSNTPPKKRKIIKWIIISFVILLVLSIGIFFIALVKKNMDNLNNTNSVYDISTTDDPYAGGENANVVIVEFSDFQCPYCFQVFPTVREIINKYGDQIKFIYRDFPIDDIHPQAQKAAEAGECAAEQDRFWDFHDKLFINQDNLTETSLKNYASELGLNTEQFNACLESNRYYEEVQQDFASGILAGVEGTPTFFINNVKFEGAITLESFTTIIDKLLLIYSQNSNSQ